MTATSNRLVVKRTEQVVIAILPRIDSAVAELNDVQVELLQLLDSHDFNDLVLDFQNVTRIGAALRNILVLLYSRLRDRGGHLAVCHLESPLRDHLQQLRLHRVFLVCDDLDEALDKLPASGG